MTFTLWLDDQFQWFQCRTWTFRAHFEQRENVTEWSCAAPAWMSRAGSGCKSLGSVFFSDHDVFPLNKLCEVTHWSYLLNSCPWLANNGKRHKQKTWRWLDLPPPGPTQDANASHHQDCFAFWVSLLLGPGWWYCRSNIPINRGAIYIYVWGEPKKNTHTHTWMNHTIYYANMVRSRIGLVGIFTSQLFNKKIIVWFQPPDPRLYMHTSDRWSLNWIARWIQ